MLESSPIFDEVPRGLPQDSLWSLRTTVPAARDELIRRNMPLARSLAARYRSINEPFDDLVQVASLALVKAVDRFDPQFGRPFSAFATPTILGELRRHFRDTGWSVHVPRGAQEMALRVQKAAEELTDARGHSPTLQDLAVYLEADTEDVLTALEASHAHFAASLDAPLPDSNPGESESTSLHDQIGGADDGYALVETSATLAAGLARLPHVERQAVLLRLQHDLKQSEIAKRLGCSQMQVSRLLRRAAQRLQEQIDS